MDRARRRGLAQTLRSLLAGSLLAGSAAAASHPPGVPYPLVPALVQPTGLAQPLPSTRRYVLVWKDQLADAVQTITAAQKDFIVDHYVGTQKVFQSQIDEYRQKNPNFLTLVYHLAYGLNGADQTNPVGNITGPNTYGQEDTDSFTPYVNDHALARENAYQHTAAPGAPANRVTYPDPFWLMDIASTEWRSYLFDTLVEWQGYPTAQATGVFLDVAFFPWYGYEPASWWSGPSGSASRESLRDWWNPRAREYFDAMRAAFAPTASRARYLVIPNTDALVDGTDEPEFLEGTDGVFTENWQMALVSAGDWNLSVRRIVKYATSQGKVWIADVTQAGTTLSQGQRERLIGTYLLVRNGTSYLMLGNSDITWYPEYELDLGAYTEEPPADLEDLRVAGSGGSSGGLYARRYASGLVLVNSSGGDLEYTLTSPMKRATFSGGGDVAADGTLPPFTLAYDVDVPSGPLQVLAHSSVVLRDPSGAAPPGEEPLAAAPDAGGGAGGAPADAAVSGAGGAPSSGNTGGADATSGSGGAGATLGGNGGTLASDGGPPRGAPDGGSSPAGGGDDGGCGCRTSTGGGDRGLGGLGGLAAAWLLAAMAAFRRRS